MIAAIASLVAAIAQPTAAVCPRGWWLNGTTPDGRYSCLLSVGDNDSPAVDRIDGQLRCISGTRPIVVDCRHVRCMQVTR